MYIITSVGKIKRKKKLFVTLIEKTKENFKWVNALS